MIQAAVQHVLNSLLLSVYATNAAAWQDHNVLSLTECEGWNIIGLRNQVEELLVLEILDLTNFGNLNFICIFLICIQG